MGAPLSGVEPYAVMIWFFSLVSFQYIASIPTPLEDVFEFHMKFVRYSMRNDKLPLSAAFHMLYLYPYTQFLTSVAASHSSAVDLLQISLDRVT